MLLIEQMTTIDQKATEAEAYIAYLENVHFPCIGAKAALSKHQIKCIVADNMNSVEDDQSVLEFLYDFIDDYRVSGQLYHSAAVIYRGPEIGKETFFDELLWQRLQALSNLDSRRYNYDKRVSADPASSHFSFSLKEEALYIIGLHPLANRASRKFSYPTLVFNPHAQFEQLRETNRYEMIKKTVRKRDVLYSGSVNPMLEDFGKRSEVFQYSGRNYNNDWQCPLKINHGSTKNNSAP